MSEEPGWYPDPYFLGRERYWDGGGWTEQCRSADTKEVQPSTKPRPPKNPDAATPSATAARTAARAAAAGTATRSAATVPPPGADTGPPSAPPPDDVPVPAAPAAAAARAASRAAQEPPPARPNTHQPPNPKLRTRHAAEPEHPEIAESPDPAHADAPAGDEGGEDGKAPPVRRRRRRLLLGGAVAVVVVIAAVAALVLANGKSGPSSASLVAQAASSTVGQQYAQVHVDVKVAKGQDKAAAAVIAGFSGSGTYDLASTLGSMTLTRPGNGAAELMVVDGTTMYLDPGDLVGQLVRNKVWISATPDDLASSGTPSGFAVAPALYPATGRQPHDPVAPARGAWRDRDRGAGLDLPGDARQGVRRHPLAAGDQPPPPRACRRRSGGVVSTGHKPRARLLDHERTGAGDLGAGHRRATTVPRRPATS